MTSGRASDQRPVLEVRAPLAGIVVPIEDVPDQVFAQKMLGPGLALAPDFTEEVVDAVAPIAGTIGALLPHAFVVEADGRGVLVHLGIDTVELHGHGFTSHVSQGDVVEVGQLVMSWSPGDLAEQDFSVVTPVVMIQAPEDDVVLLATSGAQVGVGEILLRWT